VTEGQLQDAIRLVLTGDDLVMWRNNCGFASAEKVRYGVGNPGGADLIGCFRGRFVAVEIKLPGKSQTPEQRMWGALVERKGGTYVVLRSVEEATQWLTNLRA
jgi:hypothetical protein